MDYKFSSRTILFAEVVIDSHFCPSAIITFHYTVTRYLVQKPLVRLQSGRILLFGWHLLNWIHEMCATFVHPRHYILTVILYKILSLFSFIY